MHEMRLNSLEDLFKHDLMDIYSAERMLNRSLPKFADTADNSTLQQRLRRYADDAGDQIGKLEQAFRDLGMEPHAEKCEGMEGLIKEGEKVMKMHGEPSVKDAAMIAEVQKMKHYEIAGYGTLRAYADMLGHTRIANMMADTLKEEENIDRELTALAMNTVNPQARAA